MLDLRRSIRRVGAAGSLGAADRGLELVAIGSALSASRFFVRRLGHLLAPRGSENSIELFIVGLVIAVLATLAPLGLLLFEFGWLRAFELTCRAQRT